MWCSDELAFHSCPLIGLQTQTLRNLRAHCSVVALCCVTITWQRIFKGSLQVTIVNALFRTWVLTSHIFDRRCSNTMTQWRGQAKLFFRAKKFWGVKMFDFRRATLFSLGYRLSKRRMTTHSKNRGHGPLRHVASYCVKRSMNESVAVLPQVWKIHYSVRLWLCLSEQLVPENTNAPEWIV